jgi:hypothetical protein
VRLPPLDHGGGGGAPDEHGRRQWQLAQKQRVQAQRRGRGGGGGGGGGTAGAAPVGGLTAPYGAHGQPRTGGPTRLDTEPDWKPRSSEALKDLAKFRLDGHQRPPAARYDTFDMVRVGADADGGGGQLVAAAATGEELEILVVDGREAHGTRRLQQPDYDDGHGGLARPAAQTVVSAGGAGRRQPNGRGGRAAAAGPGPGAPRSSLPAFVRKRTAT